MISKTLLEFMTETQDGQNKKGRITHSSFFFIHDIPKKLRTGNTITREMSRMRNFFSSILFLLVEFSFLFFFILFLFGDVRGEPVQQRRTTVPRVVSFSDFQKKENIQHLFIWGQHILQRVQKQSIQ
mmetsp:Transcript_42775/g.110306  ORF Transcript_42775/g.110306 Transcript_42775/m.110306 type:complete len:127 (-) Transcript_42775:654-1034(-)